VAAGRSDRVLLLVGVEWRSIRLEKVKSVRAKRTKQKEERVKRSRHPNQVRAQFKKGQPAPPGAGRPKGPSRLLTEYMHMLLEHLFASGEVAGRTARCQEVVRPAADTVVIDDDAPDIRNGFDDYLAWLALEHPELHTALLMRIMPERVNIEQSETTNLMISRRPEDYPTPEEIRNEMKRIGLPAPTIEGEIYKPAEYAPSSSDDGPDPCTVIEGEKPGPMLNNG
jgi:hypothetical protein